MHQTWLPKEEAAEKAGISIRQLERYAAAGSIRTQLTRLEGESHKRTVYAEEDLYRLARPAALTITAPTGSGSSPNEVLAKLITAAAIGREESTEPRPWMTIDDAEKYSGLPATTIRALIRSGELFAFGRGSDRRIQRSSIDRWSAAAHSTNSQAKPSQARRKKRRLPK